MNSLLYQFPEAAKFNKTIPKSQIYKYARPDAKIKELFVREVKQITWSYKLSPGTVNLPPGDGVDEIQVFTIQLKQEKLSQKILETIDRAIPSPILYILTFNEKKMYSAAYKRANAADKSKRVISPYFETRWFSGDSRQRDLPLVLNLGSLYRAIIEGILPLAIRKEEPLEELLARAARLNQIQREAAGIEARLLKEKQFNRKVELNIKLKSLKRNIEELTN